MKIGRNRQPANFTVKNLSVSALFLKISIEASHLLLQIRNLGVVEKVAESDQFVNLGSGHTRNAVLDFRGQPYHLAN